MNTIPLTAKMPRMYKNIGQHLEQLFRYQLTGKIIKADNKPYWLGGDIGNIQVKAYHATICKGTDIADHITKDPATSYAYVTEEKAYIMNKTEYLEFCNNFHYVTRESSKNGGSEKTRFTRKVNEIIKWLEGRAQTHLQGSVGKSPTLKS